MSTRRSGAAPWPPRQYKSTPSLPRPPKWTELAVCTEVGTELFYPEKEEGGLSAEPAKALCRSCDARLRCLEDALTRPGELGIWGGFSERIRIRVAREHEAGKPLEDIIADDDARYYARIEARAEAVAAKGGTYKDRRPAIEREGRRVKREAMDLSAPPTTQPRKAAA